MNRFHQLTITFKLTILFVLFGVLILSGVGALAYLSGRNAIEQAVVSDLESTANEKQAALNRWLDDRLNLVVSITQFPAYRARVNTLIHDNPAAEAHKTMQNQTAQALAGFTGPNGNYMEMMIVEAQQGQVIVSTQPANQGKFNEDRAYVIEGLKGPFVQEIIYSLTEQAPVLIVSAPMKADDGHVIAVLAARLKLDEMNEIVWRRTGQRETDDAFLVDTSNLFVTQPRFISDPAVLQRGVHTDPVNRCLTGASGVLAANDYRDLPVLAVYRWMPDHQLCLIVKMDQAEAFAPSMMFGRTLVLIALATLIVASLLGFGLARSITRPVRQLTLGAKAIGEGNLDYQIHVQSSDEIGQLAHAFNGMAGNLRHAQHELRVWAETLEQRVAERTDALETQNVLLNALINSPADTIIFSLDRAYCYTAFNEKHYSEMYKVWNVEINIGMCLLDTMTLPLVRTAAKKSIDRVFQGQAFIEVQHQPDLDLYYEFSWNPIRQKDNQVIGVTGFVRDITASKRAEEALRQSEYNYRTLMEQASDGIFIADANGNYTDVNSQGCAMLGFSHEEIVHMNLKDVLIPADISATPIHMPELNAGRVVLSERRMRRKDGSSFLVEISGKRLADGRLQGIVRDITERKQAEHIIESRLHLIEYAAHHTLDELLIKTLDEVCDITDSPIGFYHFVEPDQKTLSLQAWSTRTLQEYCKAEGKGLHYDVDQAGVWVDCIRQRQPLIHNDYAALPNRKGLPAGHADLVRELVVPILREGLIVAMLGVGNKAQDYIAKDIETVTYFADVAWEIAERKRAEEALYQLNAELEQRVVERTTQLHAINQELEAFSYSVSHDLRAPLRAIDGFSRILLEDHAPQLSADATRYLGLVRSNAQQMGHLVDDLLAFSRLGRQSLNKVTVLPALVAQRALDDLRADQEGRTVELSIGDLPECQADPALLKQVFVNLLANALKFTRQREVAKIEIDYLIDAVEGPTYVVRDNGVGFDMHYSNKLFGVFQRLHRAEDYEGTGVGLAIVQRIVQRHGGHVWAEAEVDRGATFYFTLQPQQPPTVIA